MSCPDALQELELAWFEARLVARDPAKLPRFIGSTLRGALGGATRQACCTMGLEKPCRQCVLQRRCPYCLLFEATSVADRAGGASTITPPRPLLVQSSLNEQGALEPGDPLTLRVLLLGRAADHFPYLAAGVQGMCRRGLGSERAQFGVEQIVSGGPDGQELLWDPTRDVVPRPVPGVSLSRLVQAGLTPREAVSLELVTPLRILSKKRLVSTVDFRTLASATLRRVSALLEHHAGARLGLDYGAVLGRAARVETLEHDVRQASLRRWSNRHRKHIDISGVTGRLTYRGDAVRELWPYLLAGQYLGVGKATVYGLGGYEVV